MRNKICFKGMCAGAVFLVICILLCIYATASGELHWYCKRNANHTQPVLDAELSFISDFGGVYVDKEHPDTDQDKVVYLTFDAGYENGNVSKILDVMKQHEVTGAFFILGNLITRNPELVKRMSDEGHLVCNHTYTHKNITKITKQELCTEITRLENAYSELTGKQMAKFFRPPEGTFDKESLEYVYQSGYKTVLWSFAYADWDNQKQMSAQAAKKMIIDNLHNGEIMLLHPTSATNAAILGDVICELKQMGYRFGSLDELCLD